MSAAARLVHELPRACPARDDQSLQIAVVTKAQNNSVLERNRQCWERHLIALLVPFSASLAPSRARCQSADFFVASSGSPCMMDSAVPTQMASLTGRALGGKPLGHRELTPGNIPRKYFVKLCSGPDARRTYSCRKCISLNWGLTDASFTNIQRNYDAHLHVIMLCL